MRILGLSACDADAGAVLWENGRVIAGAAEERFTRQSHDPNFPQFSASWALGLAGTGGPELDAVVFADDPGATFSRVLVSALSERFPWSLTSFAPIIKPWLAERLWVRDGISRRLDIHPDRVQCVPRPFAMAANAFVSSGLSESAVLVIDSAGGWQCSSIFAASWESDRLVLELLGGTQWPHALDLAVNAFASHGGFAKRDEEALYLDLAAHGDPLFADRIRRMISTSTDGMIDIESSFFNLSPGTTESSVSYTPALVNLCGPPRDARRPWPCEATPSGKAWVDPEDKRFADLAASLEVVIDQALTTLAHRARTLSNFADVCLSGTVFADPRRVAAVRANASGGRVAVPPDPGSGGAALGAAALAASERGGPRTTLPSSAVGRSWDANRDIAAIRLADPRYWQRFRRRDCAVVSGCRVVADTYENGEQVGERVASALGAGASVGWLEGRFSLGRGPDLHRTLLVDPFNVDAVRRLRRHVAGVAPTRPLVVGLTEACLDHVTDDLVMRAKLLPWEVVCVQAKPGVSASLAGVVDHAGKIQLMLVPPSAGFRLSEVLHALAAVGQLPMVALAPLCEGAWPPAASPADAILLFMRTELDLLVLDLTIIRKEN